MLTITDLLHMYQSWIVRALDTGNVPELRRLIARRNALLEQMRVLDEPELIEEAA